MQLNSYIRFSKFLLVFGSTFLLSCVCKLDSSVYVNNKNAQIYVLNFSDSVINFRIGEDSFDVFTNSDSTRTYDFFSDYYSKKCSDCGEVHITDGYFFAYSYNKDFLYSLSDSDKFFTIENNLQKETEIILETQNHETLFKSNLLQDVETKFNCPSEVVYGNFSLQDETYLKNGKFLFNTEQETNSNVKIIVQWTNQENYVFTSPIYLIIVPPPENNIIYSSQKE